MELENRGYMGKVLYVDLTKGLHRTVSLEEKVAYLLLGGKGYAAWLLYKSMEAGVHPLSPNNKIIFATGPLTGTLAPTTGRFCVVTKSPATFTINDSYCGGFFGPKLKFAGYDFLVVEGKADEPSIIVINEDDIRVQPADDLWSMTTIETEENLKKRLGEEYAFAEIGPAGERQSPIASVFSGTRASGRGGAGAVMGSKNLKAVAANGNKPVRVCDPEKFKKMAWIAFRELRMSEQTVRSLPRYGTANILLTVNECGALGTRNFQTGRFEEAENISGESFRETLWHKDVSCSLGCTILCSKIAKLGASPHKGVQIDGPDFETIYSFGSNCGISDKEAICYANFICDLYGVDTISTGVIISFIMELYQRRMIRAKDLDGIKAEWGKTDVLTKLTEKIAKGEGIGRLLQLGVKKISEKYPGSENFAMHVKGLEIPAYDPRAAQGMGLCYAISERGACHLRAPTFGNELLGSGGGANPFSYDRTKVRLAIDKQDEKAVADSSLVCYFTYWGMKLKELHQMIGPSTGFVYGTWEDLKKLGARVITLMRLFNVREGFTRKDDILPPRFLKDPLPDGPAKGQVVHLKEMLDAYYDSRGWDNEGVPTKQTLDEMELTPIL